MGEAAVRERSTLRRGLLPTPLPFPLPQLNLGCPELLDRNTRREIN